MTHRRSAELELNFDGLTDSVTNLVGALILIVVLLLGLTHEISEKNTAAPASISLETELEGNQSIEDLVIEAEQLRTAIAAAGRQIEQSQNRIDDLENQVNELVSHDEA